MCLTPLLLLDVVAAPIFFLWDGEFSSISQRAISGFLEPGIFPLGYFSIHTDFKGLNLIVNNLVNLPLSTGGRWAIGSSCLALFIATFVVAEFLDIDLRFSTKLPIGYVLGGILTFLPLLPVFYMSYIGLLMMLVKFLF